MKNLSEGQIKSVKNYMYDNACNLIEEENAEYEEQGEKNTIIYQLKNFDYYISEVVGGEPDELLNELHAISIDVVAYTYDDEGTEIDCASDRVSLS